VDAALDERLSRLNVLSPAGAAQGSTQRVLVDTSALTDAIFQVLATSAAAAFLTVFRMWFGGWLVESLLEIALHRLRLPVQARSLICKSNAGMLGCNVKQL
jgi:hypothetical protein